MKTLYHHHVTGARLLTCDTVEIIGVSWPTRARRLATDNTRKALYDFTKESTT